MPAEDGGLVVEMEEFVLYAVHFRLEVAAGKVGPSDTPLEECVAAKHQPLIGTIVRG